MRECTVCDRTVIVDTNIVVAGFPTAGNPLPVARILQDMLGAVFPFVVSEPLLAEYRDVLGRPNLSRLHGLAADAVEAIVAGIARNATLVEPGFAAPAPDPGDQLLWDLLGTRADLILVTADKLLLRDRQMRGRVISAEAFLAAGAFAARAR